MKNFLLNLCVITGISGLTGYLITTHLTSHISHLISYLCIYFFLITACVHFFLIKSEEKKFVNRFMLVTVSKFLISVFVLLGYVFANPETAVSFIVLFALYYLVFGAFEAVSLFLLLKRKK